VRLKSLYGGGYNIQINCFKDHYLKVQRHVKKREIRKLKEREQQERDHQA